jgi:hypothetical protein
MLKQSTAQNYTNNKGHTTHNEYMQIQLQPLQILLHNYNYNYKN